MGIYRDRLDPRRLKQVDTEIILTLDTVDRRNRLGPRMLEQMGQRDLRTGL